jgi:hypothetical protein
MMIGEGALDMLRTQTLVCFMLIASVNAGFAFAGDQIALHGMESGYFITNPGAQASAIVTNDFAEGVGSHLGKYTLMAREQISTTTGAVTEGAFVIVAANGDTLHGTYAGQAVFQPTSAAWTAQGSITGGTGRFAGVSGTVTFTGSSDLSTCKSVAALSVCSFQETMLATVSLP